MIETVAWEPFVPLFTPGLKAPHLATVTPLGLITEVLVINSLLFGFTALGFYVRRKEVHKLAASKPKGILVEEREEREEI